ncbi:hypothetical protein [Aquitalea pelogenes]|uniref:hypothetical protein n=1 Tax=Aquitalea pelogenes TaxID=1293573 RepID=UPI0019569AE4|nr:hypothetical protein [Aquitalea pelogenes]
MNKDQLLAVLYDLSLTIGREVTVDALLTKVVQRLLFHTGCRSASSFTTRMDWTPIAAAC